MPITYTTVSDEPAVTVTDDAIACAFHEAYERLAPVYGTRRESTVPWESARPLIVAVVAELRRNGVIKGGD